MVIVNCICECVQVLVEEVGVEVIVFSDIDEWLKEVDIIISFIVSLLLIIGKGMVECVFKVWCNQLMLLVDIVVLCDVELEVGKLVNVYFYSVDDL